MKDSDDATNMPSIQIQKDSENPNGSRKQLAGATDTWTPKGMIVSPRMRIDLMQNYGVKKVEQN